MKLTTKYFLFLVFFLSLFVSGIVDSQDGLQYLAVARNIYYKGEPTAPTYGHTDGTNVHMSTYVGKDGKTYSPTGLGFSLAMLPSVALADTIYQYYDIIPPDNFPLANNWPALFFASFTNIFFGAGIGVVLFLFLRSIQLSKKEALIVSFIGLVSTNLFSLSKHVLAHSMFIFFIFLSFYLLKSYAKSNKIKYLVSSSASYGVAVLTYNQTFLLPLLPYIVYYLLLTKPHPNKVLKDTFIFLAVITPFIAINKWYELFRERDYTSIGFYSSYAKSQLANLPLTLFFEGLWSQLFSPGRSIFLYSPILIIPIIFWHKLKKNLQPEIIVTLLIAVIYVLFYAIRYSVDKQGSFWALWHGELSWGPRYLSPIIPFGILLAGAIYKKMNKIGKLIAFYPLMVAGLFIGMLGIFMPNQIKLHEMQPDFQVNGTYYTNFLYINLLPRYSPILRMTNNLLKLPKSTLDSLNNGKYNVKFYDGIDFAFNVGFERWRPLESTGYISLDSPKDNPIQNVEFTIINHKMAENASSSAKLTFLINDQANPSEHVIKPGETAFINIPIDQGALLSENNQIIIESRFDQEEAGNFPQFLAFKKMAINEQNVNLESIDVPYVSDIGRSMGYKYKNWGASNKDLWKTWHIHTQVYERTPDFWWLRPFYYWDIPNKPFILLFVFNVLGVLYFGKKLVKHDLSS